MNTSEHVLAALLLDLILGDPPCELHPVRLMGRFAGVMERTCRGALRNDRLAGILVAGGVVGASALATIGVQRTARRLHPSVGDLVTILLIYTTFAGRDLAAHATRVQDALETTSLSDAQTAVGRMVGRDTGHLDVDEVVRAAVESVAENTVDGVTSPLLYSILGGAPAAMAFKAVSTLDSMFGYKNEQYLRFGWASARLDDAANYLPARLTVPFVAIAASALGHSARDVIITVLRDGRNHSSPNSAVPEAAFAGALGIRLGGPLRARGMTITAPYIGVARKPLEPVAIERAVRLMYLTLLSMAGGLIVFVGCCARILGKGRMCSRSEQRLSGSWGTRRFTRVI